MLFLFTDFGYEGPYVGQMKGVLHCGLPGGVPVVDLMHDAPAWDPRAGAYLLAAYTAYLPEGVTVVAVVDPGVGGPRGGLAVEADGRWLIGPDNGLLAPTFARATLRQAFALPPTPPDAAPTFHGRDYFAPAAVALSQGCYDGLTAIEDQSVVGMDWPAERDAVIYFDRYGNAVSGRRAVTVPEATVLQVAGRTVHRARTFSDVPPGEVFWYENSSGLVEIAVHCGRADALAGMVPGAALEWPRRGGGDAPSGTMRGP